MPSPAAELGKKLTEAANAQIGLPQQIENLVTIASVQADIAKFQAQLADESAKEAKNLSEQTDRLVQETIKLVDFTRGVYWLTFILGIFALVQIVVMIFQYFSQIH